MSLYASGVNIDPTLAGSLSGQGSPGYNAYNKIKQNYAGAQGQFGADASARGMNAGAATSPNSYYGTQSTAKQGLDVGNLESALGGGVGNTAYQNALQQRDFQQQSALANQVGSLAGMSTLEQALGGLGAVGGTAAKVYGAYGSRGTPSTTADPTYATMPGNGDMSLWGGGSYNPYPGYDPTQMKGYYLQPNELNNYGAGGGQ